MRSSIPNALKMTGPRPRAMFDILVYLFENYVHADACPEPAQLARKLTAAGFEEEEISEALDWLSGLRQLSDGERPAQVARPGSLRVYADDELVRLGVECRGFLQFLENAGILDAECREMIVERGFSFDGSRHRSTDQRRTRRRFLRGACLQFECEWLDEDH